MNKYIKYNYLFIVIMFIFILSGCNTLNNEKDKIVNSDFINDKESIEGNIYFILKENDINNNSNSNGDIHTEYPMYYDPYIISIKTYEEYHTLYPNSKIYNEDYFLTHGLIEYHGITTFSHLFHEFLKLEYNDNKLTLFVEERGPETYLIHIDPPKIYDYFIEYEKPGEINEVVLNYKSVKIRDKYDLDKQEDINILKDRIQSNNYILADVKIAFSIDDLAKSEQEQFIQNIINKYFLNELGKNIQYLDYVECLVFDLQELNDDILQKIATILSEEEVIYISVNLHNYSLENGIVLW